MLAEEVVFAGGDEWEDCFNENDNRIQTLLRGVLMNKIDNQYSFVHKTILEFFAAKHCVKNLEQIIKALQTQEKKKKSKTNIEELYINSSILKDLGVLTFLTNGVMHSQKIKEDLFFIIE